MRGRAQLENGRPRSPVIVLTGTELFASWILVSMEGKRRAARAFRGACECAPRQFVDLAQLTQQLYLGLPDPWVHLRQMPPGVASSAATA